MTTDFRALCKELTNELHGYASANPHHDSDELVARARAALVAEPVPPDAGEVAELVAELNDAVDGAMEMGWETAGFAMRRAADLLSRLAPQPVPEGPTTEELHQVFLDHSGYIDDEQVMWSGRFCVAARAVLARWGHTPNA